MKSLVTVTILLTLTMLASASYTPPDMGGPITSGGSGTRMHRGGQF